MVKLTTIIVAGAITLGILLAFGALISRSNANDAPLPVSVEGERLCQKAKLMGCLQYIVDTDEATLLCLIDCLNPTVRRGAAYTLGERRVKAAVEPLIRKLRDRDCHTRRVAARALGKIGDFRAAPELARCVENKDELLTVRCDAAWALGRVKDPRVLPALIEAVQETKGRLREICLKAKADFELTQTQNAD